MKFYKKIHKKKIQYNYKYIDNLPIYYNFDYFIFSKAIGFLSKKELEATRKVLNRQLRKYFLILILKTATVALSKKSMGSRMGKGVGSRKGFCLFVDKGSLLFTILLKKKLKLFSMNLSNPFFAKNLLSRLSCSFHVQQVLKFELFESKRFNLFMSMYNIT